nr:hypothetical protein [Tanacetum cinerariifolium]
MGDEHLDTIPATESDEVIKSSVETLILIPSECEGIPEHRCDVPSHDNSPPLDVSKDQFEDLSESNEEFSSTDDNSSLLTKSTMLRHHLPILSSSAQRTPLTLTQSGESDFFLEVDAFLVVEDEPTSSQLPKSYLDPEGDMLLLEAFLNDDHSSDFKTKSSSTSLNSLLEETNNFDNYLPEFNTFSKEEIIHMKIDQHPDNAESNLMESLRTHDSSLSVPSKIDSLLYEFDDELTLLKLIPPGIDETDCDFKEDIRLIEKLLYDNSSPRSPEKFVSANSDAKIKSFSPSPILVLRIVTLLCRISIYFVLRTTQCRRVLRTRIMTLKGIFSFLRTCLAIIPFHLLKKKSFYFDIPLFSCPPAKPPDGDT